MAVTVWAAPGKLNTSARMALARLRAGEAATDARKNGVAVTVDGELDVFITGRVTRAELEAAGARVRTELPGIFTASILLSAVEAVEALPEVRSIQGSIPVEPELNFSVPSTNADKLRGLGPTFSGLNGSGVILGDVDTGVDYSHGDFVDADGISRFLSIWDQSVNTGPSPSGFAYGTEWSQAQIIAGVSSETDTSGHGTHVMGIMGGDGSATGGSVPPFTYVGMAPMADLIMVKTPRNSTEIVDGVAYIFARAAALGKNAVCNLSLGSQGGPHDGTSAFEAALDSLSGPGRVITKSAGNERGSFKHSRVFAAGTATSTTLLVAGSAFGRQVIVLAYYDSTAKLDVQVTAPNATVIGPISFGQANAEYPGVATGNGMIYLDNGLTTYPSGAREIGFSITPVAGQNMNGLWTITFISVSTDTAQSPVDSWMAFASEGATAIFGIGRSDDILVSEPGNARRVITTAAWVTKSSWTNCGGANVTLNERAGALASFSSPGPTRDGRRKPDIAAPGAEIGSATSFDILQGCDFLNLPDALFHRINFGTSMAAPHVAGATALIMQKYGAVTPEFVKDFLGSRAIVDSFTGAPWNKDWGMGKLFLGDMIDPTVTVLAPNGGDEHRIGQDVDLQWSATDALGGVTSVDLYLSRNGTTGPWESIATGQTNDGSYVWNATGPATNAAALRVVAQDASSNLGEDTSDQVWTIGEQVPALLSFLEARQEGDAVRVRWRFGDPLISFARIERSEDQFGVFAAVAVELGSELDADYAIDHTAAGTTYWYRIVGRRSNGAEIMFGPVSAKIGSTSSSFTLSRIAPNPANADPVKIEFELPRRAYVRVSVFDVRGRELVLLANSNYGPGTYSVAWNRESRNGTISPGLYFVRYQTPEGDKIQRLVVTN